QAVLEVVEFVISHAATRGLGFATLNPSQAEHAGAIPSQHPYACSVRAAGWVERSETKNDWDRQTALGLRLLSVPLCAAHRSNIREWYCDHAPRPNTWPLNITPLDQFHPRRDFRSGRSTSRSSVARRPHTAG